MRIEVQPVPSRLRSKHETMAITDPQVFKVRTAPPPKIQVGTLKIGAGYGSNMIKVLSALEAYWEQRNSGVIFQEQLLYNLWKVCNKWLELKSQKSQQEGVSELFVRRKTEVEKLRDEALAELKEVSPKFRANQDRKRQHGPLGYGLKGLSNGYEHERSHYLQTQKKFGSSISASKVHEQLNNMHTMNRLNAKAKKIVKKGFGNLSLQDTQALQK